MCGKMGRQSKNSHVHYYSTWRKLLKGDKIGLNLLEMIVAFPKGHKCFVQLSLTWRESCSYIELTIWSLDQIQPDIIGFSSIIFWRVLLTLTDLDLDLKFWQSPRNYKNCSFIVSCDHACINENTDNVWRGPQNWISLARHFCDWLQAYSSL